MTETGAPSLQGEPTQQGARDQRDQGTRPLRGEAHGSSSQLTTEHGRTAIASEVEASFRQRWIDQRTGQLVAQGATAEAGSCLTCICKPKSNLVLDA